MAALLKKMIHKSGNPRWCLDTEDEGSKMRQRFSIYLQEDTA
jgi:hypothetical protein